MLFYYISISKTAKTKVSATKEKRLNKYLFCRVEFILPIECANKIRIVPISVGENLFLLLHVDILKFISISKTAKTEVPATKEKEDLPQLM